ncbi:Major facilitator superfamily protein [Arabidopsis thaliana]|uniref:Protein NRT1/ PTR FAMILY 4.5 n=2 Tax=Arabidopsis thaliana TaxID=3702 RepID=PTR12_ARATH|nr:Major facilitator superfamily protein [Arabidopsis thaliana]Q8VYE4.1 RecName: Full=Protein NRT1/ PTR FAMILY 4.5; Short=AtNPF4.5; AltName: Full=Protein ABA-IMPORTING TRANSPORTER 2 [Arabidopsis thaliana]AAL59956.1 putative nitrate transporter protein [Arabidopsis thaliana]AAM20085.1 putative nitrate transporter [Arabidopsis thaliana]AEE30772.1 Major facilitator superfamily protein [Arabidopsis thaliana]|eukprot:NP_174024.2 Major facilitator superfamily protein [Arabidopsis thaliana]
MEVEMHGDVSKWEGYADWRNKAALRGRHGGMLAASFVLAVEILENLAFLANASNLVLYLKNFMHMSLARSSSEVTTFMATAFLLALLGGFLADAFFSTFVIFLISASIEFLGLILLTIQARRPSLMPPPCKSSAALRCEVVGGSKAAFLFVGLYLVSLGIGGIKGSLPSHGAEQFDEGTPKGRKQRSTFFNYYVFCLSCGALVAVTFVVWIEDNKGWEWGFGVSTISIFLSILVFLLGSRFYKNKIPRGSPLTTIFKVLLAASIVSCSSKTSSNHFTSREVQSEHEEKTPSQSLTNSLTCLNKAIEGKTHHIWLECTVQQVEDVKIVLKMLPIFGCTIMLNCCLAQLSTYSVHQAATMNRKIVNFNVPSASLPVFPVVFMLILAPTYDHLIIPFARKVTKSEIGITHLQRIGVGLVLSIVAMAVAALVELKRKQVAREAGLLDSEETLPITFLWIALQYLFLGSADLFTLAGLLEFFFTEAPSSMRSLATSLSWASLALGYYLSSVMVPIVNRVTKSAGQSPWLGEKLNRNRLDLFYWLMCVLSVVNFLHYLFWAKRYKYISTGSIS